MPWGAGAGQAGRARVASGRASGRRRCRQPGAGRAAGRRWARATWVLGAQPGRAGWPWAVHLVHSAYFRSVFRLGIFPESVNEHCSL